ncbi:hypothetical protein [Tenacibaculum sp. MAR_2009_124]|uniref:hypothetical protein n=1 Tax=Tenacibaculum sp. MAR_2009_124 TaxID=1250059 RepID=UPI000B8A30BC|nr:hypothetical protein [Tenacibaculum sp. MAR_2009_124]
MNFDKYEKTIQGGVWSGTILLLATSYSLPFFFEWGGVIIAIIFTIIGFYICIKKKEITSQISIFNIIGSAISTILLIFLIIVGLA